MVASEYAAQFVTAPVTAPVQTAGVPVKKNDAPTVHLVQTVAEEHSIQLVSVVGQMVHLSVSKK